MRKPLATAKAVLVGLLISIFAINAYGQNNKGAIVGTVKDPNDALVANAQVKVTSVKTGEVRTADTTDEGTFTITNLEPDMYNVTVEAAGFQARAQLKGVEERREATAKILELAKRAKAQVEAGDLRRVPMRAERKRAERIGRKQTV